MAEAVKQLSFTRDQALSFLKRCPDCAVLFDKDWTIAWANPAFEERFCTCKAEGSSFLKYLDASSGHQLRDAQPQLLQASRQIELKLLTADGSKTVSLQYMFFPI